LIRCAAPKLCFDIWNPPEDSNTGVLLRYGASPIKVYSTPLIFTAAASQSGSRRTSLCHAYLSRLDYRIIFGVIGIPMGLGVIWAVVW
jgi:hypothetical protein